MKKISGIYQILNTVNGKFYIGSAINIDRRFYLHKNLLNRNKHPNYYLQNSWNKHGRDNFDFLILEIIDDKNKLIEIEQKWINLTNCCNINIGYNLSPTAGSKLGAKETIESKLKKSLAKKGNKYRAGKRFTQEQKIKLSLAKIGKPSNNRKNTKWPCKDGWQCKCDVCRKKRNIIYYSKASRKFRENYANV
ncbi:MAG: GIY-YIG nuclease family protein [Nanoarchaeota archaeon]